MEYGELPDQISGGQRGLYHFCKNRAVEECNRKAEHLLLAIQSIQLYWLVSSGPIAGGAELKTLITTSWK